MLKAPKHSDSLLTFRILPSFHPTPKGVGFPARKFCNGAGEGTRTLNILIGNQMLCR